MRRRTVFRVVLLAAVASIASVASTRTVEAVQCAPREIVQLAAPPTGATVPPSARFRLYLGRGCSSIPEGPPSQFRIVDARDRVTPHRRAPWAGYTELVPTPALQAGVHRLQWRHALDKRERGPWRVLTTVTVSGAADHTPPHFSSASRPRAKAQPRWGSVALSPCQLRPGWRLERNLLLNAASDGSGQQLLYTVLQWQPSPGQGQRSLKVVYAAHHQRRAGAPLTLRWTTDFGFDRTLELSICARDLSGNHACSAPVPLRTPSHPDNAWYRNLWPW